MTTNSHEAKASLLKQRLYAFRNGAVADILRKAGLPFKVILGLNLPQISQTAKDFGSDDALAMALLDSSDCRETRLAAFWIFNSKPSDATLQIIISKLQTQEEADIFAMRFIRNNPDRAKYNLVIENQGFKLRE